MSRLGKAGNPVSLPYARWVGLIALLAAEILTIGLRFDGQSMRADRPWSGLVANLSSAARLGVAVGLATLLVSGPRCYRELKREAGRLDGSTWFFRAIVGNLLAFLSFYWLTPFILEGSGPWHPSEWALVVAWGMAGLAIMVFWSIAVLPPDLWVLLTRRSAGSLVAGPALGATAYMVGLLAQDQWRPLSWVTLQLVRGLLSLVFSDTICLPDKQIVGTLPFQSRSHPSVPATRVWS
jgi:hypothetical protein